jgi:predicted ATPase
LGALTVITGANGTGKSSVYRSLRLLADIAQGRLINSLAMEGGLHSTLWAGPERISREMRSGQVPIQGTVRSGPISLKLGFSGDDFGYAIDLGLPTSGAFPHDPEIKVEAMWNGELLGRSNLFAERRRQMVRVRGAADGEWRTGLEKLLPFDSMVTHFADRQDGLELLLMRERMRGWRFYDNLRTDMDAPSRRPRIMTYTPALANDGADLAGAVGTIRAMGDAQAFEDTIADAFPGSSVAASAEGSIVMQQRGLLRPLQASELSDGTLRYILLSAALLAPEKPEILVLNEPEASLHPSLIEPLARLLVTASRSCQIVVVSHSEPLVSSLVSDETAHVLRLEKDCGETHVHGVDGRTKWVWPTR